MRRNVALIFVVLLFLLSSCTQTVYREQELAVETLTLSEVYGSPPKVVATFTGWTGVCERLEVQKRLLNKTYGLKVLGIHEGPANAECPAVAQEYTQTVILDGAAESGIFTVTAWDKRATFKVTADYQPEMIEPRIEAVDIVLREMYPVQVVAYITYDRGCDPTPYIASYISALRGEHILRFCAAGYDPVGTGYLSSDDLSGY